jgi:phosphoglycolate phosphatase
MMKSLYKHIIFDLDGTLSDSREGIFKAYYHTAAKLSLEIPPEERLATLIGPPLQKGFSDVFGLSGEAMDHAVKAFREYYGEKGLFENHLYEGIPELLEDLSLAGAHIYVATAKYEVYANRVLHYFNILNFFTDIAGADYNGVHANKTGLVSTLLQRNGIRHPEEVILIGDTRYDIDAASELEIESIGVSYGFSTYDEIERLNPDYIARDVRELKGLLITDY